jgi:MFS family permease
MAFAVSLDLQCTSLLTIYATSSFSSHSLVSTVAVIQGVLFGNDMTLVVSAVWGAMLTDSIAVVKPPMAKIADVFGRLEAFSLSVLIYVIGYIQMANSNNVRTYASAQIFFAAGFTGLQILQQVFVADTTNLLNRALFSSLPDTPFLVTVWIGPLLAGSILEHNGWRLGYGIWAITLPVVFLPLALSLFLNQRKAARMQLMPPSPWEGKSTTQVLKSLWYELDVMGMLLLTAAFSLILIPLTLAASEKGGWKNVSIVAMLVTGCVCLVIFPLWEINSFLAPKPLVSLRLLRNRTVMAGCGLAFFYFSEF